MTSDAIRNLQINYKGSVEEAAIQVECKKFMILVEIAAQLAELNEHFRKADESVFGVKDKPQVKKAIDL